MIVLLEPVVRLLVPDAPAEEPNNVLLVPVVIKLPAAEPIPVFPPPVEASKAVHPNALLLLDVVFKRKA